MEKPEKWRHSTQMTTQQYLTLEDRASIRHEFVSGHIYAMTGSSKRHNTITLNIAAALHSHLKGSPCRVFVNDLKVHVQQNDSFYYPDVLMDCANHDGNAVYTSSPVLIVEVLSRSTWMIDKREKLLAYRTLESLQEYLIVHQSKRMMELHRKNKKGKWEALQFGSDSAEAVLLQSVPDGPFLLAFAAIYDGVEIIESENQGGIVREDLPDYCCCSTDVFFYDGE